jgi:hypothetical protein
MYMLYQIQQNDNYLKEQKIMCKEFGFILFKEFAELKDYAGALNTGSVEEIVK